MGEHPNIWHFRGVIAIVFVELQIMYGHKKTLQQGVL